MVLRLRRGATLRSRTSEVPLLLLVLVAWGAVEVGGGWNWRWGAS